MTFLRPSNGTPAHQQALAGIVSRLAEGIHPQASVKQIPQWLDPSQADVHIQKALTTWPAQDSKAARNWINDNGVSEVVRKALSEN